MFWGAVSEIFSNLILRRSRWRDATSFGRMVLLVATVSVVGGCTAGRQSASDGFAPQQAPPSAIAASDDFASENPAPVDATLFLIGDAGRPAPGLPILEALQTQAAHAEGDVAIIYLGDNLYESGLPALDHPRREVGERRLGILVNIARDAGVKGIFMPGNHDWDDAREDGWRAIIDQQEFIDGLGLNGIAFLPKGGCPGPEILDLGRRLRVVILDTQWWLHDGPKPTPENSDCAAATEAAVLQHLDSALAEAGERQTVIAAHHPFDSGGPHGGYFGWKDHLFPLRRVSSSIGWLPLPGVGSFFVLARSVWKPTQDLGHYRYRAMTEAIESVAARHNVIASTGGHDHSLQVLRSPATGHVLVSGTGPSSGLTSVASKENTLFAASEWGFMQLEITVDGRARVKVYGEDGDQIVREVYRQWLNK